MTRPFRCIGVLAAGWIAASLLSLHASPALAQGTRSGERASGREATPPAVKRDPQALLRAFLTQRVASREVIDSFLDPTKPLWAKYDPELGYLLRTSAMRDGMDGALSFYAYSPTGERRMVNWADRRCRINTYGDSFTQCHQVSDGESWQEYLAAHFGEPIRNYGVGGFGVYQAYRRMLREEATANGAEWIVLNIYDDDHRRSLMGCRLLMMGGFGGSFGRGPMFHGTPWVHLRLDPESGQFQERESACPTPESLYKLCDADFVYETFREDFSVQMAVAQQHGVFSRPEQVKKLCQLMRVDGDLSNPDQCRKIATELRERVAFASSLFVLDKAAEFCRQHNKKLLVLLSYSAPSVLAACDGKPRFDQSFVDALKEKKIPFVDSLEKHVEEFRTFRLSPQEYVKRYYIGHYNPKGNHFFAFAVKDAVVGWLAPKPPAYRKSEK